MAVCYSYIFHLDPRIFSKEINGGGTEHHHLSQGTKLINEKGSVKKYRKNFAPPSRATEKPQGVETKNVSPIEIPVQTSVPKCYQSSSGGSKELEFQIRLF